MLFAVHIPDDISLKEKRCIYLDASGAFDKMATVVNPLASPEEKTSKVFANTDVIVPWSQARVEHGSQMTLDPKQIIGNVKSGIKGLFTNRMKDIKDAVSLVTALPSAFLEAKSVGEFIGGTRSKISAALGGLFIQNRKQDLKNMIKIGLNTGIATPAYIASQALWTVVHPPVRLAGSAVVATATYAAELIDKPVELINKGVRKANSMIE